MMKTTLKISGMHCASCATILTKAFQKVPGVKNAVVNYSTEKAAIDYDEKITNEDALIKAVKSKGYNAYFLDQQSHHHEQILQKKELAALKFKVLFSVMLSIPAILLSMVIMDVPFKEYLLWALSTPIQFYVGWSFYQGTWNALKNKSANMDTLIAVGTSAAYFFSVYALLFAPEEHQYFEISAVLITLVLLGKYLEAKAKLRTSEAIKKLMTLGAKTATVIRKGKELKIPIEEVIVGDFIIVKP